MSYNVNNIPKPDFIDFIDKRVSAAVEAGVKWRVTKRDGEAQMVTQDMDFNRYNFELEHGVIVRQYMG